MKSVAQLEHELEVAKMKEAYSRDFYQLAVKLSQTNAPLEACEVRFLLRHLLEALKAQTQNEEK